MAFSYVTKTGDGTTKSFTFAFEGQDEGYIRESDIVATVDGVSAPFTLLTSNTLEFTDAPSNGSEILIRRVMPKEVPYADFQRGNNFGQDVLNNSFLQLLYVVHELLDGWFPEGFTIREAVEFLEDVKFSGDLLVDGKLSTLAPDPDDPKAVPNFEEADLRFVNVEGDMMQGPLYVNVPVLGSEPARKEQLDQEISNRQSADANIQSQLTGEVPLEASAFSPISWHDQSVDSSVVIPDNKNAWSFGPTMEVPEGVSITIGTDSFWTIAEGLELTTSAQNFDEGEL